MSVARYYPGNHARPVILDRLLHFCTTCLVLDVAEEPDHVLKYVDTLARTSVTHRCRECPPFQRTSSPRMQLDTPRRIGRVSIRAISIAVIHSRMP